MELNFILSLNDCTHSWNVINRKTRKEGENMNLISTGPGVCVGARSGWSRASCGSDQRAFSHTHLSSCALESQRVCSPSIWLSHSIHAPPFTASIRVSHPFGLFMLYLMKSLGLDTRSPSLGSGTRSPSEAEGVNVDTASEAFISHPLLGMEMWN